MENYLSIVVPVYNVEKYVRRCILSIINQNDNYFKDIELIIVNDGTEDQSVEKILDLVNSYDNITLVNQENKGLSEARNAGLALAKGDYIWFVDSDDWIEPNSLKKIYPYLDGVNDVVVLGAQKVSDSSVESANVFFNKVKKMSGVDAYFYGIAQTHTAQFSVYRKSFLEKNNLYFMSGIYHEDEEFCPKVSYLSKCIAYLPYTIYNLYVAIGDGRQSITTVLKPKRAFDSLIVAGSLSNFVKVNVAEIGIKTFFDSFISMVINNALSVIVKSSAEEQKRFNKEFYSNYSHLSAHLARGAFKYKLEALLLKMLPHNIVGIYKFLQLFNLKQA